MKQTKNIWDRLILHPLLFAIYPTLMLWLANIDQVRPFTIVRPLVFSLVFVGSVLLLSRLVFRGWRKAAVFTTLCAILFFSYGHVFQLVDMKAIAGFIVGRHRFLLPFYLLLFIAAAVWVFRARAPMASTTRMLNYAGGFMVAAVAVQIAVVFVSIPRQTQVQGASAPQVRGAEAAGQPARDVYYIILDAYGRQDLLAENDGPDISGFVQQLRDMGFSVQDCAQSNYTATALSLSSSLNMNYLQDLGIPMDENAKSVDYWDVWNILHYSQVRQAFERMGYQTVTFKTVYSWLDITDSNYYYDVEDTGLFFDKQETLNFYYLFLRTTVLRTLVEVTEYSPERFDQLPPALIQIINPRSSMFSSRHYKQYQQNLYALEKLNEVPALPGKKFVYAHLFITHQPYTFNVDGSMRWPILESREAYYDQVRYANIRMLDILKTIIEESEVPPVIILQGDHSYEYTSDRVKILNAYYLPEGGDAGLYPEITPVNTFRLVLNTYFGGSYPYLPDVSYLSPRGQPYQFEVIPNTCASQ